MSYSIENTFNFLRLLFLIFTIVSLIFFIYFINKVSKIDNIQSIISINPTILYVLTIIIFIVTLFCIIILLARLFISPLDRMKFLDKIYFTTKEVVGENKNKTVKELTFLGHLLDYPFNKIKIKDKKGNIVNVTRVKDDIYQGDDGNIYSCLLGKCKDKPMPEIKYKKLDIDVIDSKK